MNGIVLHNINMLHLLWVLPFIFLIYLYGWSKKKKALELFIEAGLINRINISSDRSKRYFKSLLIIVSTAFVILSLTRPSWNPVPEKIERRGRDIVFLLDVSKSMLAEDLVPNRIERAKLAINDCIDGLMGDRVALVAFAGTAAVKCPLTQDYGFFRTMLKSVNTESIARGGTMIGDAIRLLLTDVFDDQAKEYKDIILITDGEDHDSFPIEAAKKAGEKGIRIIAIGIGDENEGKRIPVTNENGERIFLKYNGQEVWSKLDADTLRKMVNMTPGGKYFNVATGTIDLGTVYRQLIAGAENKELESETINRYEEKFQIFLSVAFFLLCIEFFLSERKRGGRNV
ncbi:MAG: VWA domain-containing protein [Deltaproteobacteria bacterium]|nr:VWA domain-containing protein [Deltaproteobacteria bacterium]